jgi:polyhydroxybutyrate depolymerase
MKRFITTFSLLFVASIAYGQGQTLDKSLVHDGMTRNYTVYVPSTYSPQVDAPLVVNLHGYTLNRGFQMTHSGMNAVARIMGFLLICIGVQFVINGIVEISSMLAQSST